jgi:hypothetical protein
MQFSLCVKRALEPAGRMGAVVCSRMGLGPETRVPDTGLSRLRIERGTVCARLLGLQFDLEETEHGA